MISQFIYFNQKSITYKLICTKYQFLLFRGIRGCCTYLLFIAIFTDIGIGSIIGFIIYGPIMLLGLKEFGFIILFIDVDFIGYRQLLVLFCLYLSPFPPE